MVVTDFVPKVYYVATGKTASFLSGSPNWLKILAMANIKIDDWVNEPNVDWGSLYQADVNIGTVSTSQTYPLPSTIRKLSQQEGDVIRILNTDGVTFTDYTIIDFTRQKDFAAGMRTFQDNYVQDFKSQIRFNRAFTATDPQYGGTIYGSGYGYPPVSSGAATGSTGQYLVLDTDVIPVDIPNWLVYATAALFDMADVTRQNLVPNLAAQANELMQVMKANNQGQDTSIYRPWQPLGETWVDQAWS